MTTVTKCSLAFFFWAKELVLSSLASYSVNLLVSLYTLLATFCLGQWLLIWQPVTLPLLQTIQRSLLVSPWMYNVQWPVTVDSSISGVLTYVTPSKTTHPMSHMQRWLPYHLTLAVGSSDMPTLTNLPWVSRNCPSSHGLTDKAVKLTEIGYCVNSGRWLAIRLAL